MHFSIQCSGRSFLVAGLLLAMAATPCSAQPEQVAKPAEAIRNVLQTGDLPRQKAVLFLIPELGLKGPEAATTVTTLEAYLRRAPDVESQCLALSAYGKLGPTAPNAAKLLQPYLRSTNPIVQRSAVQAVSSTIMVSSVEFAKAGTVVLGDADAASAIIGPGLTELWLNSWRRVVSARHMEDFDLDRFSRDCAALLPLYSTALDSTDEEVKKTAADGLTLTSQTLAELFANAEVREEGPARIDPLEIRRRAESLQPAFVALNKTSAGLRSALDSPNRSTRLAAVRAADSMGVLRRRTQAGTIKPAEDPLRPGLTALLPIVTRMFNDPSAEVRLTAVEAIEQAGPEARSQLAAVIQATRSDDLFVRWVATRTLGKILAASPDGGTDRIVAALGDRVADPDLDVVSAAMTALAKGGNASRPAIDAVLKRAVTGDPDTCTQAIYTLESIDKDRRCSVAGLMPALRSDSPRIRKAAVVFLGRSGKSARSALGALAQLIADPEEDVRKEAARSILLIEKEL